MRRSYAISAALAAAMAGAAWGSAAHAQRWDVGSQHGYQESYDDSYQGDYQQHEPRMADVNDSAAAPMQQAPQQMAPQQMAPQQMEELPSGRSAEGSYVVGDDSGALEWDNSGQGDGYSNDGYCGNGAEGCCPSYECGPDYGCACEPSYGQGWALTDSFFNQPGQFFIGGEWLYVRASFSEATAYAEINEEELDTAPYDRLHQLNFTHESGFRFYGGYRLCKCGEEIRWAFTQYNSSASTNVPASTLDVVNFVPFEVVEVPEGGGSIASGDVDLRAADLEYAKTIPLGGPLCCDEGCGECCDCCDPCACPTWDITWSGGVRFASVDAQRQYLTFDDEDEVITDAVSKVSFDGGGPRVGVEGRRYFGRDGWCSAYMKGNLSLLLGNVNIVTQRTSIEEPEQVISQYFRNRQIIPVTEIEAGLTTKVTRCTSLTAGYLFAAYHDLGYREEYAFPTNFGTFYDDANILGFDGMFIRVEADF